MIHSKLILQSGEEFPGLSPKWQASSKSHPISFGEVVFTTGMVGYVESLTDPSYAGQILVFTYPLIGNYGVPERTFWESEKIQASAVVVTEAYPRASHWNAKQNFLQWLESEKVPLIAGVDTRALTMCLRRQGVVLGAIATNGAVPHFEELSTEEKKIFSENLLTKVSCKEKITINKGSKRVIVVDCGIKTNIIRNLCRYPLEIVQVPYDYDYSDEAFDGLFISNGPGDPSLATATIAILQKALKREKPTFGICLGAQLMALAIGGSTYKLKFGHRGQNHPCLDIKANRAILTAQNHGFAIDPNSLPKDWETTFVSLNDHSVEGIAHKTLPFFAVQFHPEHHPGPWDAAYLFDQFYEMLQ
jgi:carbamoyl-phosphate synthase small subunit